MMNKYWCFEDNNFYASKMYWQLIITLHSKPQINNWIVFWQIKVH